MDRREVRRVLDQLETSWTMVAVVAAVAVIGWLTPGPWPLLAILAGLAYLLVELTRQARRARTPST